MRSLTLGAASLGDMWQKCAIDTPETELAVDRAVVGRRAVLRFHGEVDLLTAPQMRAAITDALDAGAVELWLDFTPTDFMDSTGLHVLLEAHRRLTERSGRVAVICPDGSLVHRLLVTSGTDALLTVHPDVGTAHRAA